MAMNKGGTWERWEDMPSNSSETDTKTVGGISRRRQGSLREVQAGVRGGGGRAESGEGREEERGERLESGEGTRGPCSFDDP